MANRNGEPPPTAKVQLTDIQRDRIEHARADLANSAADEIGDHSLEHQAVLEYRLESLLEILDGLTGGGERDIARCRKCDAVIHRPGEAGRWFSTSRIEVLEDPCDHEPEPTGGAS
jgi:hypothetical protein